MDIDLDLYQQGIVPGYSSLFIYNLKVMNAICWMIFETPNTSHLQK